MSLYGYKNVQLITHRTHRQIADSPNAPTAPTMPKLPDSGRITGNPHLTPVSVGCCSRARVCLDRRSETQIFVDPGAFVGTDPPIKRFRGPRGKFMSRMGEALAHQFTSKSQHDERFSPTRRERSAARQADLEFTCH